jgi:hypothetical protein
MTGDNPWPRCSVVAWIACQQCEEVLARVHEIVRPWNYTSNLTSAYAILPSQATFSTGAQPWPL